MPQLSILEYPDPRLRLRSEPVSAFDADLGQLIDDLLETLYAGNAIGLSAPQVDDRRRVLVADLSEDRSDPQVYVNPEVLSTARSGIVEESCLSVPGVVGNVVRPTRCRVRAQDRNGASFERDLDGMNAVCVLHEVDHLEGKLFIDKLSPIRRFFLRNAAKAKARKSG